MQPGKRGYGYTVVEVSPYYTRDGSYGYAAQIRALYEKWLAGDQAAPVLPTPKPAPASS